MTRPAARHAQGRPFIVYRRPAQPAQSLASLAPRLAAVLGILLADVGVLWAVCAGLRWVVVRIAQGWRG